MRIVIVKLSSIGDVVHALPAVAALRLALPDARISWVVERRASAMLKGSPVIDELIEIDTRAWRSSLLRGATIKEVRAGLAHIRGFEADGDADIAIDFQGLIKSGIVAKATGALRRIGFETRELRERASRFFLTEQIETSGFKHVIDKNIALASAVIDGANFSPARYEFPIVVSAEDERYIEEAISNRGGSFAIINPGGGWPTKLWPATRYGQLADHLHTEHGLVSFITYGPGEESLVQTVAAASKTGAARPFASTLKQFVALARRAALFVGGDTGPLHLAAASGTPIVGIYGPTSPDRNGPFDKRDVTVKRDLWCRADCHRRSCWHWECMDIAVSAVASAVATRLERADETANSDFQRRIVPPAGKALSGEMCQ
ncbi:MAG TPA: glycosyltransferase family 9 protein [Blastocatellia bacterium]|nr:glycosyltransferase family 9 protein [Blastocatellia bacterium]